MGLIVPQETRVKYACGKETQILRLYGLVVTISIVTLGSAESAPSPTPVFAWERARVRAYRNPTGRAMKASPAGWLCKPAPPKLHSAEKAPK
jgi:hypothetical protein